MGPSEAAEVWRRLIGGGSLEGLGLPMNTGLVDLRRLVAPEPTVLRRYAAASADVKQLGGLVVIRGAHWKRIDLSGACLNSLRFFDSTIEDCSFDGAACQDSATSRTRGHAKDAARVSSRGRVYRP